MNVSVAVLPQASSKVFMTVVEPIVKNDPDLGDWFMGRTVPELSEALHDGSRTVTPDAPNGAILVMSRPLQSTVGGIFSA